MEPFLLPRKHLESLANQQGLIVLGIVTIEEEKSFSHFKSWLDQNKHGEMKYLENHLELRQNPQGLLEGAKSGIIFGKKYSHGDRYDPGLRGSRFRIAQYARMKDYHRTIKRSIDQIAIELLKLLPGESQFRSTVDSAPLLERALAAKTHKGFIGKNTLYIHPDHGSLLLLGELLTTANLISDPPARVTKTVRTPGVGGCGSCKRCQVLCPTGALDEAWNLDARKCLSYLTIEHRGIIPVVYWKWLEHYIFGCDICQLVCPWNRNSSFSLNESEKRFTSQIPLPDIVNMSQSEYEQWFGGTPVTRAKKSGLKRNALIAMIVSSHPELENCLEKAREENIQLVINTIAQIPEYQSFTFTRS